MSTFHEQFLLMTVAAVTIPTLNGISHHEDHKMSNQSRPKTMVK